MSAVVFTLLYSLLGIPPVNFSQFCRTTLTNDTAMQIGPRAPGPTWHHLPW